MPSLIIAEAALELIPEELKNDKYIINHAKRLNRKPNEMLLDRSYHHRSMLKLKNGWKRGRPDLIHVSLLAVTPTPLYKEGSIDLYIHTIDDKVLVLKGVRLPRTYARFEGLIIDLFKKRRITSNNMLMEVHDMSFEGLMRSIKPSYVIGLSRIGEPSTVEYITEKDCTIVIGGFPRGHFSNAVIDNINELISISRYPLDTHVVCSRIVYEYEKRLIR